MKKFLHLFVFLVAFVLPFSLVQAGNIEISNSSAHLEINNTTVQFVCPGCNVNVTDTEINGLIWGESLGWVNLQPSGGGVSNTRMGILSGNAWGSISGWVDFVGVSIDNATGEFSGEAISQNRGPITFECPGPYCVVTTWRTFGCTDLDAVNYDPTAGIEDGSCQIPFDPIPEGCTDPLALNYNPLVIIDNGTCNYGTPPPEEDENNDEDIQVLGCTDSEANNFIQFANVDNGSCLYGLDIPGCMDPSSNLFNPDATVSDPNACFIDFYGCMDPQAVNFNPGATIHNNSCFYESPLGCTDPLALNFSPIATTSDDSCVYDIPENGCTDSGAVNYNPNATFDNGTCIFLPPEDLFVDANEDNIPDVFQEGEQLVENLLSGVPGAVGDTLLSINNYIVRRTTAGTLLATALLVSSLLQTIPFREGNLLFSFFSFYKTRRYWGTVYDSVTKQPLDPAYVTLFDEAGQAIDTSITDIDGRYSFIVPPGKYFLSAQKTDYRFPSNRLKGKSYDEIYSYLYFGGDLVIEKEDDVISRNIPMDPLRFNWNEYAKQKTKVTHFYRPWHRILNIWAKITFIIGFIFALWIFTISPSVFSFVVLSLYIVTTILKVFGLRKIPRGYVKDKNGFAVHFGIIRVFSEKMHREVKHTIIGPKGHYLLLVPKGRYYMTVEQKIADGTYKEVYKTGSFKVRKGYIAKKITINADLMTTADEKFETAFISQKKIA